MSRKLISQIVTIGGSYAPTKCALYLRPTGVAGKSFSISATEDAVIDATNFLDLVQGTTKLVVADTVASFTGVGYLEASGTSTIDNAAYVTYPIKCVDDGKYYVHLRIKASAAYSISIGLDNVPTSTLTGGSGGWTWITGSIVVFDGVIHNLSLLFTTAIEVDEIVISKSSSTPSSPTLSTSPYVTTHVRLASVSSGLPTTYYDTISYHTTADLLVKGGWYNFFLTDTSGLPIAAPTSVAIVLSAAGTSSGHYVIWDTADTYNYPIATQSDTDGWVAVAQSMSIRVFSDYTALNSEYCELVTPEATLATLDVGDFSDATLRYHHENTIFIADEYSGDDVELNMGEKAATMIVDQTGSMTWNDQSGVRFDVATDLLETLQSRYPSNIRFNLLEMRGEPSFSMFVPLTTRPAKTTVAEIVKSHFANDSDYFAGIRVIRKKDSFSESFIDGEIVSDGYMMAALDKDLEIDTNYYYTVYTYDQKLRPSRGIQLIGHTATKDLPRGLPNITAKVYSGYDFVADANTAALWNMDEGSGDEVYDFGVSETTLSLYNHKWLDFYSTATGVSGLRFNGFSTYAESSITTDLNFALSGEFSISFWINPFDVTLADLPIIVNGENTGTYKFAVLLNSGTLKFSVDSTLSQNYTCNTPLTANTWTHVGITYNNGTVKFYLNGTLASGTNPGGASVAGTNGSNNISIGKDATGNIANFFFGKLTHLAVHNVERDAAYMLAIATPSRGYTETGDPSPIDNGDRLVVFTYTVPDDANYSGIRIVRNSDHIPSHERDGTKIKYLDIAVSPGVTTKYTVVDRGNRPCCQRYYVTFTGVPHAGTYTLEQTSADAFEYSDDNVSISMEVGGSGKWTIEYTENEMSIIYRSIEFAEVATCPPKLSKWALFQDDFGGSTMTSISDCYYNRNFDLDHTYYYRVFTSNNAGNWCPIEDATKIAVHIPDIARAAVSVETITGDTSTFVPGPGATTDVPALSSSQVTMRNGNDKVYFTWEVPASWNDAISPPSRVAIFYSEEKCPQYNSETKEIDGGSIIFDGTLDKTEFVHRKVGNRKPGYYILVPRDRYNRFNKNFTCFVSLPREDYDDSGIPLLEVSNVSWHLDDYDRIRITWDSPVTLTSTNDGWFDDRFFVYAAICDLYGNPIPFAFSNHVAINSSTGAIDSEDIEDVFHLGFNTSAVDQLPVAAFYINADGLITGTVRLRPNPLFTVVNSLSINVSALYTLSDNFKYQMPSGTITFKNPLQMSLTNRDGLYLKTQDFYPPKGCNTTDEEGGEGKPDSFGRKRVNGTFIRRKQPFAIRASYTYKDAFIPSASTSVKLFDATGGPCGIVAQTTKSSKTVVLSRTELRTQVVSTPLFGPDGQATSVVDRKSFTDILVKAPYLPQSASAFVMIRANGYQKVKKMHMFFPSTLRLELTAAAPLANNIDVREEFAKAYFVDPDFPSDMTKISLVPNLTVAKWKLTKGDKPSTGVPFYSSDSVPLKNGTYSYFRSGIARNVFFGPADTKAAGTYVLTVSVTASGLFSQVAATLVISTRTGGSTGFPPIPDPTKPRIFCEFPNCVNYLWADGKDYQRLTIYRNPTTGSTTVGAKYDDEFRTCSEALISLPVNTSVSIEAEGYEILSGDVSETTILGKSRLNDSNATISIDSATVKLGKNPHTYVYFRKSAQIEDNKCRAAGIDSCACYDAPTDICYKPYGIGKDTDVIVKTKVNIGGKPVTIYGGGGRQFDGRPPTILIPIEPLYLNFVGLFIEKSGTETPVNEIVFDGTTINYLYFELRYAGHALPENTQVAVKLVADRDTLNGEPLMTALGIPDKVFTYTTSILPGGIELETTTSLVKVPVGPLSPTTSVKFLVYVESDYSED